MDFLKKNYEKIILAVVLLGLALAAAYLPMALADVRGTLETEIPVNNEAPKATPLNISTNIAVLNKLRSPTNVVLAGEHNLFNPVKWKQNPVSKELIKIDRAKELPKLVSTRPLLFEIRFVKVEGEGFTFSVLREAAGRPGVKPVQRYVKPAEKIDFFRLKEVKPSAENATTFVIELADTREEVIVTRENPYQRTEGYSADFRYEVENRVVKDVRVGQTITFGDETYKIIAITLNEARVQANSNQQIIPLRTGGAAP